MDYGEYERWIGGQKAKEEQVESRDHRDHTMVDHSEKNQIGARPSASDPAVQNLCKAFYLR